MPYAKTKDGSLVNEVTLGDGYPLSNDLQPLKVGGEASPIEMSTSLPDDSDNAKVKVRGDLEVTGGLNFKNDVEVDLSFDDLSLSGDLNVTGDVTVDTDTLKVDSSNNRVGIGTTSPNAELHLHSASGAGNLWITGPGSNPSSAGNLRFAEQEDGNNFFQFSHDGSANTLSVDSNNQDDMTVWDRSYNRITHAAQNRFYRAFPQVTYSDDSGTDYVQVGISSNDFIHKTSDTDINFIWNDNSNNRIMTLDTGAETLTIGEGSQSTYTLKIGDNGRMNMPQRGLEFENAHGYFSPLGDMFMPLFINGSQTDLIRFQTPITFEYWDYSSSAWVDDSSNVGDLQKLLDGRRSTSHSLTNTKRKFRFVIERESNWADDHLFYIENTWSSIGTWTTSASGGGSLTPTMVVERLDGSFDASDDTNNDWTTNSGITTDWHTTGIWNGFGLAMYYSTGMHNTEKHIRVTITFPEYADTSKTISLKNIGIISSYSSANSNRNALVQDFNRNMTGYGILNLTSGHEYRIDNTSVVNSTTLGSGVVNSSLTSVGTLSSLTVNGSTSITGTGKLAITTSSDAVATFKMTDDAWGYMEWRKNDNTREAYMGMDSDMNRFLLVTENDATEVQIDATTVDMNATLDLSGNILFDGAGAHYIKHNSGTASTDNITFRFNDNEDVAIIRGDGRVGIGLTAPTTTLDVEGTVSYKHTAITSSSDSIDVSGTTVLECDSSGGHLTIGGFTGGVQGQILYVVKTTTDVNRVILENNEGGGSQDIYLTAGLDVSLGLPGGIALYCNGSDWFALDK